jgi:hypothetical protein
MLDVGGPRYCGLAGFLRSSAYLVRQPRLTELKGILFKLFLQCIFGRVVFTQRMFSLCYLALEFHDFSNGL